METIPKPPSTQDAAEADIEVLFGIQCGEAPNGNTLDRLERLGESGWVEQDAGGTLHLTAIGTTLLMKLRERVS